MGMEEKSRMAARVVTEVRKAVIGKDDVVIKTLMVVLARGHVLLEDIPGVGKTTMALAFSRALGLQYNRVQFTPDVLPSDLTGFSVYNRDTRQLEYQKGALFCNLLLADELNRATSRTQSALLEAMEEGQVTVDGKTYAIPSPFLVIATQNPVGAAGTQLLPDSQLDRFMMCLTMGYPKPEEEIELLRRKSQGSLLAQVERVLDHQQLELLRQTVDKVYLSDEVMEYIVRLVTVTRRHPRILQGGSPRATLAVASASRAAAFLWGRDYVLPEDIRRIWCDTVAHRLLLASGERDARRVAQEVLDSVQAPKIR